MGFELFIALRYLTSRRRQTFISVISILSVLGVALGVGSLIVVLGVYNGFSSDIRNKILGANSHILLHSSISSSFDLDENGEGGYKDIAKELQKNPEVLAIAPFIYTEVLLSTPRGATGLIIRGIDPKNATEALPMLRNLESGTLDDLVRPKGVQGILIGTELAARFALEVGDRINLMSPAGERTTAGFVPKIKSYRVAGIFKAGLNDYDSRLAFVSLDSVSDLIGSPIGRISGLELFLKDPFQAQEISEEISASLGFSYYTKHWIELNTGLFSALKLERIGMFIVLSMIILIGSFSIITSLVMLVMEKTKDIAILMSMGATPKSIRRIFMMQGTIIGMFGTFIGYVCGLGLAFLLQKYKFIELPPGIYTTDYLPIVISFFDTFIVGVASMFICFLATIYPAIKAAKLVPTDALRYE